MPVGNVVNDAISTPINYTITIDLDGGSSTPENPTSYTILDTITLNNPTKIGYSFNSWIDNENNKTLTVSFGPGEYGDKYFKALWDPDKSTKYIVNYYVKDVGKTTYTLRDTVDRTGETDQVIKISDLLLDYSGCSFSVAKVDDEEVSSTKIKADGTLVVDIYYTRDTYKVSLNLNTGITEVTGEGSYEFEAEVTVTATLAEGYEWLHWSDGVNSTED
jgi:hypothetical protein